MKKIFKLFGIIALAVVIGFALTGCDEPVNDSLVEMVWVSAGTFLMGPDVFFGNSATVEVTFTKGFYMSKYLVTQELYETIMGFNPSHFLTDAEEGEEQGRRPVELVSWFDALDFCNRLSEVEGFEPVYTLTNIIYGSLDLSNIVSATVVEDFSKNGYRLPTDAQWEYAARGGNGTPGFYTYSGSNNADDVAWYSANSGGKTREVGLKEPNGLGIYDMSGNVDEWCWDWWGDYPTEPVTDYYGAATGSNRVYRGGSFYGSTGNSLAWGRHRDAPGSGNYGLGFRLVRP